MSQDQKIAPIESRIVVLRLSLIDRDPGQPRKAFSQEEIEALARNIRDNRLIHPIYVRPHPQIIGRYMLVAGERRFRALQLLGVEEFEFRLLEAGGLPPYIISIIENKNRVELNPIEEAESYAEAMRRENLSPAQLAAYTGEHPSEISRALKLLRLPVKVQDLIREGKIKLKQARIMQQFRDVTDQIRFAEQILAGENPPELDEIESMTDPGREARIRGHLPKTGDGLIRRMLSLRQRMASEGFVIEAFLGLSEEEQIAAWTQFTQATRANFQSSLQKFAETLGRLNERMNSLPETKRTPSGIAATKMLAAKERSLEPPREAQRRDDISLPAPIPKKSEVPAPIVVRERKLNPPPRREPAPLPNLDKIPFPSASQGPGFFVPRGQPKALAEASPEDISSAERILEFIERASRTPPFHFLSRSALSLALGNGHTTEEAERAILRGLRTIGLAWKSPLPSAKDSSQERLRNFVGFVSQRRHDTGDMSFQQFLSALRSRDASPDAITLEHL